MEKDILQNHFETVYKDYKDYESLIFTKEESIKKEREGFRDLVLKENYSIDSLVDKLFELSIKPIQSEEDLRILRERLLSVYDAYKIVIDFPTEIINEINNLKRPYVSYRIDKGEQVVINKEINDSFKENRKKRLLEIIEQIKLE